jgi:hypothetical protein
MEKKMEKKIDVCLRAILSALLLLCLLRLPYGYYELVRFTAMAGFAILAYLSYRRGRMVEVIIFVALAILFQPLLKISLGKTLWKAVDVAVAAGLIASLVTMAKKWIADSAKRK